MLNGVMRKKLTLCLLTGLTFFNSCVDSKYDLSDVDTDDVTIGDEWVAPLGTGVISIEKLIDFETVNEITTDPQGNYIARYSGNLKANLTGFIPRAYTLDSKAGNSYVSVADASIDLRETMGLFDANDLVLSLVDPRIKVETRSNVPASINSSLSIESQKGNENMSTSIDFEFTSLDNKLWIGADRNAVSQGYVFIDNKDLGNLIKIAPEVMKLDLGLDLSSLEIASLPENPNVSLDYTVEIPFAPAKDFKATLSQSIDDAFDEDFVDYVFSGGTATISGKVKNGFPLGFSMNLVITDQTDRPVGIRFTPQQVAACTATGESESTISFLITEQDMDKMNMAKNIRIELEARGDALVEGISLNKNQKIALDLKLKKTGGIVIDSSK